MYQRDSKLILFFFSAHRDREVSTEVPQLVAHTALHSICRESVPHLFTVIVFIPVSKY